MGLTNYIRNIPKKPSTQSYRKFVSFRYIATENSDSKVINDFFRKSYLQKDWFGLDSDVDTPEKLSKPVPVYLALNVLYKSFIIFFIKNVTCDYTWHFPIRKLVFMIWLSNKYFFTIFLYLCVLEAIQGFPNSGKGWGENRKFCWGKFFYRVVRTWRRSDFDNLNFFQS